MKKCINVEKVDKKVYKVLENYPNTVILKAIQFEISAQDTFISSSIEKNELLCETGKRTLTEELF